MDAMKIRIWRKDFETVESRVDGWQRKTRHRKLQANRCRVHVWMGKVSIDHQRRLRKVFFSCLWISLSIFGEGDGEKGEGYESLEMEMGGGSE